MSNRIALSLILVLSASALADTNGTFKVRNTPKGMVCISKHPKTKACTCPQMYHTDIQLPPAISAGDVTVSCIRGTTR